MTEAFRSLSIEIDPASEIRTAEFNGASHMVVPAVLMVGDSAIEPMGSDGPEFIPSDVLAAAPQAWNGSPVLPIHPVGMDGTPISANSPDVLQAHAFGQLFNVEFSDGKLRGEAWLDTNRATSVGEDAVGVVEIFTAAMAGETTDRMAELSIGGYVAFEEASGEANGKTYNKAWTDIKPDHLAIFSDGSVGACSNDLGCGAPRVNKGDDMPIQDFGDGIEVQLHGMSETITDNQAVSVGAKVMSAIKSFVVSTDESESIEIVALGPLIKDSKGELYRPEFIVPADHTLIDMETGPDPDSCQCHKGEGQAAPTHQAKGVNMNKEELVGRLVNSSPFTEEEAETLSALSEERLTALADEFEAETPAPIVTDSVPVIDTVADVIDEPTLTEEEQIDALPEALKSMVRKAQAQEEAHREHLITSLSNAQTRLSEDALKAKDTETLEDLSAIMKLDTPLVDNSLRGNAEFVRENDDNVAPPVPSLSERIIANRAN